MTATSRTIRLIAPAAALVVAAAMPLAREQKSAPAKLTIDALVEIKHPSNPVWSRDSARVAFMWERAGVSNLYVVPADGSTKPIPITTDGRQVAGVTWSADSKTLYFTSGGTLLQVVPDGRSPPAPANFPARGGTFSPAGDRLAYINPAGQASEIHIRSVADGTDRVVTTFAGPAAGLAWSIDATRLTFTSGGGRGQSIRHEQTPDYSGNKIIYTVTENVAGAPGDLYSVPASGGTPTKHNTGVGGGGAGGGRGGANNRWLDATRLLVDRQTPDFKRRTISIVDTTTGNATLVQEDVKATFWSVVGGAGAGSQVSPNGKWISFLSDKDGWDHIYVARASGSSAPTQMTKGTFEAWRPAWSPNSTQIAFDANQGPNPGARHIFTVDEGGTVRQITTARGVDIQPLWSPDGRKILYQHSDPQNSADLYVVDAIAGAKPVRLTDSMPASIDKSALVEPQLVKYPGPDGKDVPAYLFVPKNLDRSKKHPAIVWIHGDGVNQNYDGWHVQRNYAVYYSVHQYFLQQGYVVIAPDYRGSIGYGSAWREGVYMDVGGKDFRDAALVGNYLKTLPYVDADRLGVWGLSYGGFFTLLAVTEYPTMYRAAVDVAGVADYAMYYDDPFHGSWTESRIGKPDANPQVYAQASPVSHIDKLVRPLLVLHGTADVNVPYLHSVRLIDAALKAGKGDLVEFMTYPGEFHYFTREHVLKDAWSRVDKFFAKHLAPEK